LDDESRTEELALHHYHHLCKPGVEVDTPVVMVDAY
jgi:hypothetical protein